MGRRILQVGAGLSPRGRGNRSFAVSAEDDRLGNLVITFFPMRKVNAKRTGWLVYHKKDEG